MNKAYDFCGITASQQQPEIERSYLKHIFHKNSSLCILLVCGGSIDEGDVCYLETFLQADTLPHDDLLCTAKDLLNAYKTKTTFNKVPALKLWKNCTVTPQGFCTPARCTIYEICNKF
ncbi:hypothetical protein VTP01DRAFT_5492 [Rhizomucor pusillus]|uniref:uncharacterized protein n=1 Tax=Rhizomucor pusillus TaxID=4840 RepID=UPI003742E067